MDKTKLERIRRFINDKATSEAVFEVLMQTYLKPKEYHDMAFAGGYRIATDLLQDAWKELTKLKDASEVEAKERTQVGL